MIVRAEIKTHIQNSVGRLVVVALSVLLQILWLVFLGVYLKKYSTLVNILVSLLALGLAIKLFNRDNVNANFKMPWIMLLLSFPVLGAFIFLMYGDKVSTRRAKRKFDFVHKACCASLLQKNDIDKEQELTDLGIANQFKYLEYREGFPLYKTDEVQFYSEAKDAYEDLLNTIKNAQKYVFLEYHAIENKISFSRLLDILVDKCSQGLDVRILYDDIGSIGFLNSSFSKKMESIGIKCKAFNKISPAFRFYMNNRDHRKIAVVDGMYAFTGGYNIADEYFNITHPYGEWKDTGIKFSGEAVASMLCMFLEMWNSNEKQLEDLSDFKMQYDNNSNGRGEGYILPYADNPLDEAYVGENVYMNMVKNAKTKVLITTPYLIIGDEMQRELQMAAERGVEVIIVTPGIPDKKTIYRITRSYYHALLKSGVKIYEYEPGFLHSKQIVVDGEIAVVGTINLDYRSLYHHFENAVLMYKVKCIRDIEKDFDYLISKSRDAGEMLREKKYSLNYRITDGLLRLVAPLL